MNAYSWDELTVGLSHCFDAIVTEQMMSGFLAQTGDINPLHVDAEYARSRGFDSVVVYGLLASSFYSTLVGVYLPGRDALLHGLNLSFQKPVYVGVPLQVFGQISVLSEAYRRIEIAASISSNGEQLSKAKILVGLL
jgi:3-hydroxybutyryl-CoA dehydratase